MPISRRKFLVQAGVATAASYIPSAVASTVANKTEPASKPYVVLEQSGSWSTGVLVYGVLAVANPSTHLTALRELRIKYKYRRALRHRSLDRLKLPYALAVADYFLSSDDFYFAAVVLKKRGPASRKQAIAKLTTTIRERGGPQVFEQDVANMKKWEKTSRDNLRQLADGLTGAVYVDATDNENEVRNAFAVRLRGKLKVKNLDAAALGDGKRFSVVE